MDLDVHLHIQVVSFVKSCVSKHDQLQSSELKWSPIPHGKWYHNGKILSNWSPTVVMWSNLLNFWHPVWFFNGPLSFSGSFVIPCWQLKRFLFINLDFSLLEFVGISVWIGLPTSASNPVIVKSDIQIALSWSGIFANSADYIVESTYLMAHI